MSARIGVVVAALLWLGVTSPSHANPALVGFTDPATTILGFRDAGRSGLAVADLDGDGSDELVFGASASSAAIMIAGRRADQSIGIKQTIFLSGNDGIAQVISRRVGNAPHIFAVMNDGKVYDFAGWPLQQVREFPIASNAMSAAIGDLYSDGNDALVVMTDARLYAYALNSALPLWDQPLPSATTEFALAQLDGDPALEIVLGSGTVLDSATFATEWTYGNGIDSPVAAGHLLGDGSTQFVASSSSGNSSDVTAYRGAPWQSLWTATLPIDFVSTIATANLDNNGRDVILVGDAEYHGAVHVIDSLTHQERFAIPNSGDGLVAVTTMKLGGSSSPAVAFATRVYPSLPAVNIVDSHTGAVQWSFVPQTGNFAPVAIGDVDGDGHEELIAADYDFQSFSVGLAEIYDYATGVLKWQSSPNLGNGNDPFFIAAQRILLSPGAPGATRKIAFVGKANYDGRITQIDGKSHAVTLDIYNYATGPLASRLIGDSALVDYDNDGLQDFLLATQPDDSGTLGVELMIFSGKDGHLMWTSDPFDKQPNAAVRSVMVTGPVTNPASQIIALTDVGVYAFNLASGMPAGNFLATADGATLIPNGAGGAEIATFAHMGAVTFYDAATQNYLRSFALDAPVNAILPLGGDVERLLVSTGGTLSVVDGISGSVLASSDLKNANLGLGNQLAATPQDAVHWHVAAGNDFGVFRYTLDLRPDDVFADGFGD
jgi:hypothetical protein